MPIEPMCFGGELQCIERSIGDVKVSELTEASLLQLLKVGRSLQEDLCDLPIDERLAVIGMLGEQWQERVASGELSVIRKGLAESTGYPLRLIDLEFSLVPQVLNADEIMSNLEASLVGGQGSLERFVSIKDQESLRYMPSGPVLIISSGNSLIPTLIPTVLSLVSGNFTLLKPSLANFQAVVEVFSSLKDIMNRSPAAHLMARALAISYFVHDSPGLRTALTSAPFGVINFWGGEPSRIIVSEQVSRNPHHPRFFANGPLTGMAVISEERADDSAAKGLALNMVLYEQQLCSSPTMAVFIGSPEKANAFALRTSEHLDSIGSGFRLEPSTDALFILNSVRKVLAFKGAKVYSSTRPENPWTLAVSPGKSVLDQAVSSFPSFSVHGRRRFLEMVVVQEAGEARGLVDAISEMIAFRGVDKVQTIGMAAGEERRKELLFSLASSGAYRFVPLEDMFMRSALEPYDGTSLASLFTYAVYERSKRMTSGESI